MNNLTGLCESIEITKFGETKIHPSNRSSIGKTPKRVPPNGEIYRGLPFHPASMKKKKDLSDEDFEGIYLEMREKLKSLNMTGGTHADALLAIAVFFTYDKNLPSAIELLTKTYSDKEIPQSDSSFVQGLLHSEITCHLKRVVPFTANNLQMYIQGHLKQLNELYQFVLQNDRLRSFFEKMSKSHGCFEDRIKSLYEVVEDLADQSEINGDNFDDRLPKDLVVAEAAPQAILAKYYDYFDELQTAEICATFPKFEKLKDVQKQKYLKKENLNHLFSYEAFCKFLKTTRYAELMSNAGKIKQKDIQDFWKIISDD